MRVPASGNLADFGPSRPYVARTTAICQVFAIHPQRHLSRIGQCSDLRAHMLLGPPISDHFCHAPASLVQTDAVSWVERAPTGLTRKADYVRASEPHLADPDESDRAQIGESPEEIQRAINTSRRSSRASRPMHKTPPASTRSLKRSSSTIRRSWRAALTRTRSTPRTATRSPRTCLVLIATR